MVDRLPMAGGLGQPDISRNRCLEYHPTVEAPQIRGDRWSEVCSFVVHRQQEAFDPQLRIDCATKSRQGIEEFRNAFERIVFALNWDQQRIGGGQGVEGEQVQSRRAVKEDELVICFEGSNRLSEDDIAVGGVD